MSDGSHVKEKLLLYAAEVEEFLSRWFRDADMPEKLCQAMTYSLMSGGKRLRPALCLAWGEMLGESPAKLLPFAAAVECIHTYSLIHDDLPAMDNDDLRRGKPTSHKQFGEATAILAGDGLLTEAFTLMHSTPLDAERVNRAVLEMSTAAGCRGMVGGQLLDMEYTGEDGVTLEELKAMHGMKTGALITASCVCGAVLAGAREQEILKARHFGQSIGLAFQVVDDILDLVGDEKTLGKPVGSDVQQGKNTYPSLLGLDQSYTLANECIDEALVSLKGYSGDQHAFLKELSRYIVIRAN